MDLEIFGDQEGDKLFPSIGYPSIGHYKDDNIKKFFGNGIDLYIDKKGDRLTIICHILAHKGKERYQGYYVKYVDDYNNGIFTNFKKSTNKVLYDLGLEPNSGDINNAIFDNIGKFDLEEKHREDINAIIYALNSSNYPDYKAGNIDEIAAFCNDILKNIDNTRIVISSKENKFGEINIMINKRSKESLIPSEKTRQILYRYRKNKANEEKKIKGKSGEEKIKDGIVSIKEGLTIKKMQVMKILRLKKI